MGVEAAGAGAGARSGGGQASGIAEREWGESVMADSVELRPGVRALDHTADLGFEVRAESLSELFHRAAAGMMALIWEGVGLERGRAVRQIELEAEDVGSLLVLWLRELLYLQQVHGFAYASADFERLSERKLRARVRGGRVREPPVRELKGVTYHDLEVRLEGGEWVARVIFDV